LQLNGLVDLYVRAFELLAGNVQVLFLTPKRLTLIVPDFGK
jgi:hypothetical protein